MVMKKKLGVDYCNCMTSPKSCEYKYVVIEGRTYKRNSSYYDYGENCHDCWVLNKKGNIHHIKCDIERCPKCKDQLLSCGHGDHAVYRRKRSR